MQLLLEVYMKQREQEKYPGFFLSVPLLHHLPMSSMDHIQIEADKEPMEKNNVCRGQSPCNTEWSK